MVTNEEPNELKEDIKDDTSNKVHKDVIKHSKEVNTNVHHQLSINNIDLFDKEQLLAAENFLSRIIKSDKSGIKSVNDGLAILMRAKDLNLPFSVCIEHIHCINGKTGIDVHLIKALLLRAGCTWKCIKDYQPLYEYTDGINAYIDGSFPDYLVRCKSQTEAESRAKEAIDKGNNDNIYVYPVKYYKDFNGNVYKDYQLHNNKFEIAINRIQAANIIKSGKIAIYRIPNVPVDYVTEYEFTRVINGEKISAIGRFSYNDASVAEMFTKDTYKHYPKVLISHRAFTYGARDIASDVLLGAMETTELKIVTDRELNKEDIVDVEDVDYVEIQN